jgi:hypothetical protein
MPNRDSSQTFMPNRFGVGMSYATGFAAYGAPEVMISTLYKRLFTGNTGMELAIHYMAGKIFNSGLVYGGISGAAICVSWTADMSFMVQSSSERYFSLGIGPSFRSVTRMETNLVTLLQSPPNPILTYWDATYTTAFDLGVHIKLEYQIPISDHMECTARLQYHHFLPAYLGTLDAESTTRTSSIGIGAFLHVYF